MDSTFSFVLEAETGLTRLAGGGDDVGLVLLAFVFDLSRRVLELTETGTATRGAEAIAWEAVASKDAKILRVRSSHPSVVP